jgi:hypothetical protein
VSATLVIEICAALAGVAGTWLLARKGARAGWGFVAYLASNAGWLVFAWMHEHWGLFVQQIAFTVVSLYGIWTWLIEPALDHAVDAAIGGKSWISSD